MATVGENILRRRKQLGWTQEELAKRMGYTSKSTINKIEAGINNIPQNKIARFAEVLGLSPTELMGWNDREPNKVTSLSDTEKELINLYRNASSNKQKLILGILQLAANNISSDEDNK